MSYGFRPRYASEPTNRPLTALDVVNSAVFGPAVLRAMSTPQVRGYVVDKSLPWDAVDLPLVTELPQQPKDRAEVNLVVGDGVVRMLYRASLDRWFQIGAAPTVTALPALTVEGLQIVYDTGTAGVRWQFVYDSTDGTTYPWLYVGGSPLIAQTDPSPAETTTSTTYANLTTTGPSITLALAGEYLISARVNASNTTANVIQYMSYAVGGTGASDTDAAYSISTTSVGTVYAEQTRLKTVAAGDAIVAKYKVSSNTGAFERRGLTITPRRVG